MARILQVPDSIAPTVAQQMFVVGSGIAGGVGGYLIARQFANVKEVPLPLVVGTTLVSVLFTLGAAIFLARAAKGEI